MVTFVISNSVLGSVFIGGTVAEPSQFEHPSNACTMSGIKIMSLFQISILVGGSSAAYLP